jgi:transcriptional regulator GlxA family with amidase domain
LTRLRRALNRLLDVHARSPSAATQQWQSASLKGGKQWPINQRLDGPVFALSLQEISMRRPRWSRSRATLARLGGVSPRHLDRLFAQEFGRGFLETYRLIRLTHARRLLEQSSLSISSIAFATGFSSASHFSRACKAILGQPPGAFRRKRTGERSGFA